MDRKTSERRRSKKCNNSLSNVHVYMYIGYHFSLKPFFLKKTKSKNNKMQVEGF